MATKAVKTAKKRGPQDLTLRNLRAMKTRLALWERHVEDLEGRIAGLEAREAARYKVGRR